MLKVDNQKFDQGLVVLFFQTESCLPCKDLLEKIKITCHMYPKLKLVEIKADENRELCAHFNVYSAPTILLLTNGKEAMRKGIYTSINEIEAIIQRIYGLMYEE